MSDCKLYIVEGLPCAGKSTTSRHIAEELRRRGHSVTYRDEGSGDHPADYEFHAFLTEAQLAALDDGALRPIAEPVPGGWILPLAKLDSDRLERLLPHKIYDGLPWAAERPLMLHRWRAWAEAAARRDEISVFNCVFLQNPLCETMMRFDMPRDAICRHVEEILSVIRPLNPTIVYLKTQDAAGRIAEIARERDPAWLRAVIDYHTLQGYGKARGLTGFEGYAACLEARQSVELEILDALDVRKIILTDPFEDWNAAIAALFAQI